MKAMLEGLREFWEDIEKSPFMGPPGYEKGGRLTFILWFGGWSLLLILGFMGFL